MNGGGNDTGYDYARYASSISFSDGAVGILRNYWASLILPPDKSSDIPDKWQPDQYDKALWRGLLTINFDMTGDTWDPAKLEGVRELIDIYHYLEHVGLVGRWVHVYRPAVQGDDPTMYFERFSRDGNRGIIILKHVAAGPVVVRPKGLNPADKYLVSYQESNRSESRTGADLMKSGITIDHQSRRRADLPERSLSSRERALSRKTATSNRCARSECQQYGLSRRRNPVESGSR